MPPGGQGNAEEDIRFALDLVGPKQHIGSAQESLRARLEGMVPSPPGPEGEGHVGPEIHGADPAVALGPDPHRGRGGEGQQDAQRDEARGGPFHDDSPLRPGIR